MLRPTEADSKAARVQDVLAVSCPQGADWFKATLTTNARGSAISEGFYGRPNIATTVMCARNDLHRLYKEVSAGAGTAVLVAVVTGGHGRGRVASPGA